MLFGKHTTPHEMAGKQVTLSSDFDHPQFPGGSKFVIEDWWYRIEGKSWMHCDGNPACLIYAMRLRSVGLPIDDRVVYGHVGAFGCLVHESAIEKGLRESVRQVAPISCCEEDEDCPCELCGER